ncbi:response regulator transcription factor [soil metagenome]
MSIIIADDHPFTLLGTKTFVESLGYRVKEICNNGITAWNIIQTNLPEIAILDIDMPGMSGFEVTKNINAANLKVKVVLLTIHKEMSIYKKATEMGVYGYIPKNFAQNELEDCLRVVTANRIYTSPSLKKELIVDNTLLTEELKTLTLTERKVLELVAKEMTSARIAELLFISERTVEGHRRNIIEKLQLPKENNILVKWAVKNLPQ